MVTAHRVHSSMCPHGMVTTPEFLSRQFLQRTRSLRAAFSCFRCSISCSAPPDCPADPELVNKLIFFYCPQKYCRDSPEGVPLVRIPFVLSRASLQTKQKGKTMIKLAVNLVLYVYYLLFVRKICLLYCNCFLLAIFKFECYSALLYFCTFDSCPL